MNSEGLSEKVLSWVVEAVGGGHSFDSIVSIDILKGGMSSLVYRISLSRNDCVSHVVLRQFNNKDWIAAEPDLARHEAESLVRASLTTMNTPNLIAFDETGSQCGMPSVLMSHLEGEVVLTPLNIENWLDGMAEALVKIHTVQADDFPWVYFTYGDIATLQVPSWSSVPELWERAIKIVQGTQPEYQPCFIHRDYHPTNILWAGNNVSGVVDWVNSCRGPAGIDVGHCRLNLAMLSGVQAADQFLKAYCKYAGSRFQYDPYWDILSLVNIMDGTPTVYPGWTALGFTGLTDDMMAERLDQFLQSLF